MNTDYKSFRHSIQSLNLSGEEYFNVNLFSDGFNKRLQLIHILLYGESVYLKDINVLLTNIFRYFDRNVGYKFQSHIISKDQVMDLLRCFPTLYTLHFTLHQNLNAVMKSSGMIGMVLFNFLRQPEVLETYGAYYKGVSDSRNVCKIIKEKSDERNRTLKDIERMILSPLRVLTRLNGSINDLYNNTLDDDNDKAYLFKAMMITKYILTLFDTTSKNDEDVYSKDVKQTIYPGKIYSNCSVSVLNINIDPSKKFLKTPYSLVLNDKAVFLTPKFVLSSDESFEIYNKFPVNGTNIEKRVLSRFNDLQKCSQNDTEQPIGIGQVMPLLDWMKRIKNLYISIKGYKDTDHVLTYFEECINDYCILQSAYESVKQLTCYYREIDKAIFESALAELEKQLSDGERKLNMYLNSILVLKSPSNGKRMILFDSRKKANDWRKQFYKVKLLEDKPRCYDWFFYATERNCSRLSDHELPYILEPFLVKTNIFKNTESVINKCLSIRLVVGQKLYNGLWTCLANGLVIVLYFDYDEWHSLHCFQLDINRPISDLCEVTESMPDSAEVLNSDICMASDNQVLIYSLLNNQCSELETRLDFESTVNALCTVYSNVLVALKSNVIFKAGRSHNSVWSTDLEISLETVLNADTEITKMIHNNGVVYVVSDKGVVILKKSHVKFSIAEPGFQSEKKINGFSSTRDGILISFAGEGSLHLYDSLFKNILQTIALPPTFLDIRLTGSITCLYSNESHIWIGTEEGFIFCMFCLDSQYCVDENIPFYSSSRFGTGPIIQILPFQNFAPISVKKHSEKLFDQNNQSMQRNSIPGRPCLTRNNSCPDLFHPQNGPQSDRFVLCDKCLQNAYEDSGYDTTTLIIAIGTGITKYQSQTERSDSCPGIETINDGQSTIFTFLE